MAGGATSEAFTEALEHSSFLASVNAYGDAPTMEGYHIPDGMRGQEAVRSSMVGAASLAGALMRRAEPLSCLNTLCSPCGRHLTPPSSHSIFPTHPQPLSSPTHQP